MKYFATSLLAALAVVLLCAVDGEASLAIEPNAAAPKNPGFCFSKQYKKLLKIDQEYQMPDSCGVMSCGKSYIITYEGCSPMERIMANGKKCPKKVQDSTLPFPQCCPRPVCEEDDYENAQEDD